MPRRVSYACTLGNNLYACATHGKHDASSGNYAIRVNIVRRCLPLQWNFSAAEKLQSQISCEAIVFRPRALIRMFVSYLFVFITSQIYLSWDKKEKEIEALEKLSKSIGDNHADMMQQSGGISFAKSKK